MPGRTAKIALFLVLLCASSIPSANAGWDNLKNDIEVVYLFEQYNLIDWPLVFHLAVEEGCRVKMVTAAQGETFGVRKVQDSAKGITLYKMTAPSITWSFLDSMYAAVAVWRQPDIVISSQDFTSEAMQAFERYWLSLPYEAQRVFQVRKVYRRDFYGKQGSVHVNNAFYISRHLEEMKQLARELIGEVPKLYPENNYNTYNLVKTQLPSQAGKASIVAGFERFRLDKLAAELMVPGMALNGVIEECNDYLAQLDNSEDCDGVESLNAAFGAVETLKNIKRDFLAHPNGREDAALVDYVDGAIEELSEILVERTGITLETKPYLRKSPQGMRLKVMAELQNNGPLEVKVGNLRLHPYWSNQVLEIEPGYVEVMPYKKFVREYTLELPDNRLETLRPESLLVTGEVDYYGRKLEFATYAGTKVISPLSVKFLPDFVIIQPFPKLEVDRLVTQLEISAIITKPVDEPADLNIKIETPSGIMAGAFEDHITMPAGVASYEFAIPVVATKSIPVGKDRIFIKLYEKGKLAAVDTCMAAVAENKINDKVKIALIPDDRGILEDIFIMTGANYKTISDRFLESRGIRYYDVIAIGTGADKYYPSLAVVDGKLRQYIEDGGTVLVFGQRNSWSEDNLPVSIQASEERLAPGDIAVGKGNHRLFDKTYKVDPADLIREMGAVPNSYPATVFPAEEIIASLKNGLLLAETRMQKGKLIYCGLPVPEMVRDLDRDALKFFTNIINYSGE